MNLYLDDDSAKAALVARLRKAGHQVAVPTDQVPTLSAPCGIEACARPPATFTGPAIRLGAAGLT